MKPFICALKSQPQQTGIALSEHLIPLPDNDSPTGIKMNPLISVLWDEVRSPAPSYHSPQELVWLSVPDIADPEDDEDDEDEVDDSEDSDETDSDE